MTVQTAQAIACRVTAASDTWAIGRVVESWVLDGGNG